ncbi:MAG: hypothetical protein AAF502_11975 [Bacteroidota bacterium]
MKTVSDELFQLIKSLTKQEKRYFKLYASRHVIGDKNKYVILFDAIDKQEKYDEVKIKRKFRKEVFVKQLHVTKNYLRKLILDSLRNFHATKADDKFHTLLRNAQILFDKGLSKQSAKVLNKAKKSALDNERFLQLLEIYQWEHSIIHTTNDLARLEEYVSDSINKEFEILAKYQNLLQFRLFHDQIFAQYWRMGIARKVEEKKALAKLLEEDLFQNVEKAKSISAKFLYYNSLFAYYYCISELEKCYEPMQSLVQMIEDDVDGMRNDTMRYIGALNNLYVVQKHIHADDEGLATLKKMREIPAKSPAQKAEVFTRSYLLETDFYISKGYFTEAMKSLYEIESGIRKLQDIIDPQSRLAFYYNLSLIYFGAGNYSKALDWNNLLLNDPDLPSREDIHSYGRLINLIIHYELGNDQLLEYIVKSTHRFLDKRKRLFKVETIILNFIKKYPNWITEKEMIEHFKDLHRDLFKLTKDDYEKHAFDYFDFISWLESKIYKRNFEVIVLEKSKKQAAG